MRLLISKRVKIKKWSIIFIMLSSLGFPGNYEKIIGSWLGTAVEYLSFGLQILAIGILAKKKYGKIKERQIPIYLFLLIIFVTSFAATRFYVLEFITCFRLFVLVLFCIRLVDLYSIEMIIRFLCSAQLIFLILSGIILVACPSLALQNTSLVIAAFRGLYTTKNACASELSCFIILMAVALKTELISDKNTRRMVMGLLVVQSILLIECQATGPLLVTVLILAYTLLQSRIKLLSRIKINPAWMFLSINFIFLLIVFEALPRFANVLLLIGKDATFTGRTLLWDQVVSVMRTHNTWTGFGYGMFWRDPSAYGLIHQGFSENSYFANMTSGAHNLILELWLNIGLIGIAALAYMLLATMKKYKTWRNSVYVFISTFIMFYTFHGLTERAFDNSGYSTLLLFIVIALAVNPKAFRGELECHRTTNT